MLSSGFYLGYLGLKIASFLTKYIKLHDIVYSLQLHHPLHILASSVILQRKSSPALSGLFHVSCVCQGIIYLHTGHYTPCTTSLLICYSIPKAFLFVSYRCSGFNVFHGLDVLTFCDWCTVYMSAQYEDELFPDTTVLHGKGEKELKASSLWKMGIVTRKAKNRKGWMKWSWIRCVGN